MMDGKLFLGTARFLQSNGSDEAAFRTAISRAYYACFLVTRDAAFNNSRESIRRRDGISREAKILHEPLQKVLKNSQDPEVKQLGIDLASLHGNRKDADYKMSLKISDADAQQAIEEAELFLDDLQRIGVGKIGKALEQNIRRTYD